MLTLFAISSVSFSQGDSSRVTPTDLKVNYAITQHHATQWYDNKAMPWIASIFIAILTVIVNLVISFSTRRTSLKVVTAQIESSVNLATVQFHSTLNSKNRQDWINEVRNCISEFATQVRQLNIQLQQKEEDAVKTFDLHGKVYLYKSKLKLLLTPTIDEHAAFLQSMEDLVSVLEIHVLNNKSNVGSYSNQDFIVKSDRMIENGRQMLYFEWQKIQRARFQANEKDNEISNTASE